MKELTKAEEQVMQNLWKLEKGFLKDIVEQFPEPKPANTTVSTVIRVLVKKGFISYQTYGKAHEYRPIVTKDDYFNTKVFGVVKNFFNGSVNKFASFFTDHEDLAIADLEKVRDMLESKIEQLKKRDE